LDNLARESSVKSRNPKIDTKTSEHTKAGKKKNGHKNPTQNPRAPKPSTYLHKMDADP
jgi:hypothetical protein